MSKNSGKGCSLLTGIAIGAGLGILFAPKKGSETRKELTIKINELWDKVKELEYDDVKKSLEKKIKELKPEKRAGEGQRRGREQQNRKSGGEKKMRRQKPLLLPGRNSPAVRRNAANNSRPRFRHGRKYKRQSL